MGFGSVMPPREQVQPPRCPSATAKGRAAEEPRTVFRVEASIALYEARSRRNADTVRKVNGRQAQRGFRQASRGASAGS